MHSGLCRNPEKRTRDDHKDKRNPRDTGRSSAVEQRDRRVAHQHVCEQIAIFQDGIHGMVFTVRFCVHGVQLLRCHIHELHVRCSSVDGFGICPASGLVGKKGTGCGRRIWHIKNRRHAKNFAAFEIFGIGAVVVFREKSLRQFTKQNQGASVYAVGVHCTYIRAHDRRNSCQQGKSRCNQNCHRRGSHVTPDFLRLFI